MIAPQYTPLQAKQAMNRVNHMPFRWSLNPYRGCSHGCSFCYARVTHTFLGLNADDTFRTQIMIKSNAADSLERQLEKIARKHRWDLEAMGHDVDSIAIGTATDPYQNIEAKAKVTRSCLEVLARYRVPVSITTRSPLILRDLDLLQQMNIQSINISVNSLDPKIWRGLEPASPSPAKRLEALAELRRHKLPAGIFLAPIIPTLTDATADVLRILTAAQQHDALFVMPSILRLSDQVKEWFMTWVREHYPASESSLRHLYPSEYPPRAYVEVKMSRIRLLMARLGISDYQNGLASAPPKPQGECVQSMRPTREQLVLPL